MKPELKDTLQKLFLLCCYADVYRKEIPPTRDELENVGVLKKNLKKLETEKLCSTMTIIVQEGKGQGSCGRIAYSLTNLGREVCNQLGFKAPDIDPKKTENLEILEGSVDGSAP